MLSSIGRQLTRRLSDPVSHYLGIGCTDMRHATYFSVDFLYRSAAPCTLVRGKILLSAALSTTSTPHARPSTIARCDARDVAERKKAWQKYYARAYGSDQPVD